MDTVLGLDNHPGLKQNIELLGEKLTEYANNQCDYMDVAECFRHTTEYILSEFMKEFPECMGRDAAEQIDNLLDAGYLTDEQASVLQDASNVGDVGTNRKTYREMKSIYDDLCSFLPSFLNWFFHPSTKALPEYNASADRQNRRERQRAKRKRSSRPRRTNQRMVMYIALIVLMLVMWGFMFLSSRRYEDTEETADIWGNQQIGRGQTQEDQPEAAHYAIGETWTVEGEWEFTIDDVSASSFTYEGYSPYSMWGRQRTQAEYQLLIISYHYTDLGYDSEYDSGLNMSLGYAQIVDSRGYSAEQVSLSDGSLQEPQTVTTGETCEARQAFIVVSDARSGTLTYIYPGSGETAVFDLSWELEETL